MLIKTSMALTIVGLVFSASILHPASTALHLIDFQKIPGINKSVDMGSSALQVENEDVSGTAKEHDRNEEDFKIQSNLLISKNITEIKHKAILVVITSIVNMFVLLMIWRKK